MLKSRWLKSGLTLLGIWLALAVPKYVAGRDARALYADAPEATLPLARGVAAWLEARVNSSQFSTGDPLFDQEWVFGTYMMAGMGLGQVALAQPQHQPAHTRLIEHCLEELMSARLRAFDKSAWSSDPLTSLDSNQGHVAYLGYLDLLLGVYRELEPDSRFAAAHDRITQALARRLAASPTSLIETYPGQTFPVDNLAAIAAIAQHSRLTRAGREPLVLRLIAGIRQHHVDPGSGLLIQRVGATGKALDRARSSGTALGAYFSAWADPSFAAELQAAIARHQTDAPLGFGMVREYFGKAGPGDIDSGPLLAGFGISATGFSLGSARVAGDFAHFERVYRTAHLFGAPHTSDGERTFVSGGPLGNALMLAMLTAPKPKALS